MLFVEFVVVKNEDTVKNTSSRKQNLNREEREEREGNKRFLSDFLRPTSAHTNAFSLCKNRRTGNNNLFLN